MYGGVLCGNDDDDDMAFYYFISTVYGIVLYNKQWFFISSFTFLLAFDVGGLGFEFCVFVAGWRHTLRSEWLYYYYYPSSILVSQLYISISIIVLYGIMRIVLYCL